MSLEAVKRNGHNLDLGNFTGVGAFDVPIIHPENDIERRLAWLPFNKAMTVKDRESFGVHFFIDDYMFQRVWNDPARYAQLLKDSPAVMSPDFSLYADWPVAVQIYNHWRKHYLAAYWQSVGVRVIPTICWSDHDSYDWCFDGEPVNAIVAVSSVGTQKSREAKSLFLDGYNAMMERLSPTKIIFFGDVPKECAGNIEHHKAFYRSYSKYDLT